MPISIKLVLLLLLIISTQTIFSQSKYEKEIRIGENEVPIKAKTFVEKLQPTNRVRWFKEIGLDSYSYEAKTKINGKRISIEFSSDGEFEDIETTIKLHEIPTETRHIIQQFLATRYERFKIDKIQRQYSGEAASVLAYMADKTADRAVVKHFEIVISVKEEGSFVMREYLFDEDGNFISSQQIIHEIPVNLIY